jgi:hypothetical protein
MNTRLGFNKNVYEGPLLAITLNKWIFMIDALHKWIDSKNLTDFSTTPISVV